MPERVYGHFGEFLQGILSDGSLGLISIPCADLFVEIAFYGDEVCFNGKANTHLTNEIAQIYEALRLPCPRGIDIHSNMLPGGGAGFSTALRLAVIKSIYPNADSQTLLTHIAKTERAIDPLMLPNFERILWKSRQGKIARPLPALPTMEIIGGFGAKPNFTDPEDMNFSKIDDLIARWAQARSLDEFASIASEAARRNLETRQKYGEKIFDIAETYQAKGIVIAHTGSARGLIFSPHCVPDGAKRALEAAGLDNIIQFHVGGA